MAEIPADSINKIRHRFWISFAVLVLLLLLGWCFGLCHFQMQSPDAGSLLGGPGGLTLLAIVVALSAYLRGVASSAVEERAEIAEIMPGVSNPALKKAYENKMERLNWKWANLHVAAPFMMLLSIAVTTRLLFDTLIRGGFLQPHIVGVRVADFLILAWLTLTFLVLCILHHYAWRRDEELRIAIIHAKETNNITLSGSPSATFRGV